MKRQLYFFKENFAIISDNYLTDKYLRRQLSVKIHTQICLNIYFVRYVFLTFFPRGWGFLFQQCSARENMSWIRYARTPRDMGCSNFPQNHKIHTTYVWHGAANAALVVERGGVELVLAAMHLGFERRENKNR